MHEAIMKNIFGTVDNTYNDIREKSLFQWLEEMEQQFISTAWEDSGRNLSSVAQKLGVSRQTLYTKLKKYGVIR